MQNCASAVVIDLNGHTPTAVTGCLSGLACGFSVADSTFDFSRQTVVRASRTDDGAGRIALYAAGFPSPSPQGRAGEETSPLWLFRIYVTENGTTTESTFSVSEPLPAGGLKVIKARIGDGGQVVTDAPEVGVSVKLDWKPGGSHDVEM